MAEWPAPSDGDFIEWIQKETRSSFVATTVKTRLAEKNRQPEELAAQCAELRRAIYGVRQFAPASGLTPEQAEGYDLASKDLLLLASPVLGQVPNELPPLGWGRNPAHVDRRHDALPPTLRLIQSGAE